MKGSGDDNKKVNVDDDDEVELLQQIKLRLFYLWGRVVGMHDCDEKHIRFLCEIITKNALADKKADITLIANAIHDCNAVQGLEMEQYILGLLVEENRQIR